MLFVDHTLPTLAENLALDEALLKSADELRTLQTPILRLWESAQTGIVVGRSSRVAVEVQVDRAAQADIPILRRPSGGATVVVGPGCLLYSLLIDLSAEPGLRMLDHVHRYVMTNLLNAIRPLVPGVRMDGTCDLVWADRKFSGNSLKVGRDWTLYHGTILIDMDLNLIDNLLQHPPREPEYRGGRSHSQFVTNLSVDKHSLITALRRIFRASQQLQTLPLDLTAELARDRYLQRAWNFQR